MSSNLKVNNILPSTGDTVAVSGIVSATSSVSIASSCTATTFYGSGAGIDIGADTNINRPEAGVLGFNINSSEKVRINSDGKVGIGTVTPLKLLHLSSATPVIRLTDTDTAGPLHCDIESTSGDLYLDTGSVHRDIIITSVGKTNEIARFTGDGKVGIGTNNPSEILNIYGTNVKPVIGDRTAHTVHYSSYDSQNNTTLEISSSGTGTNVAGLALNNPTTSANSSYKTLSFCCSGTSSTEKRGAIISSNHDAASGSAIKGNLSTMVNNGSGLQTAMFIGHQGHVTKARTAMFSARGQGSWNTFNSGSGWYNLGDSSFSGSNYYINHSWTTSGGGCGVRGVTDAGNSIWENDKARFTAPVAGFYFFEISLYIRTYGGGKTFHVQPWLDSANLNYYTSNIGNIRNSSDSLTGNTQQYPNSVMRSIVIYMTANQNFRWSVYSEGTTHFQTHFDYAHQSGYLIG